METIFALSSGAAPSGIAVLRVSGTLSRFVVETIVGALPEARAASLRCFRHPGDRRVIDRGIVLWFPGPGSFNGDDCAEFHVHGGIAVIEAMLDALGSIKGLRLAMPGEFSRRAFENGKLDLAELEGLADLVAAETEAQRRQAMQQADGHFSLLLEDWRQTLVSMRAGLEAGFDFSDEDDVPDNVDAGVCQAGAMLRSEIERFLGDKNRGVIVRSGYQVMLMGAPNSGKSSLLNALAKRDVAIVSSEAGTTRDLIEVSLDLEGYRVVLVDTAGLREDSEAVERQGMERALARSKSADLVVWLQAIGGDADMVLPRLETPVLLVHSKDDFRTLPAGSVSVKRQDGLDWLIGEIARRVGVSASGADGPLVTRHRHRVHLERVCLLLAQLSGTDAPEYTADLLRQASNEIGRITGRIGVEDLLDEIFSTFCIGK